MPIATSPYSNNDYQAASQYRPYNLPVNEIMKATVAMDEFWKEGARRVKAVHDHALNLNLTTTDNKILRDEFMKKADKDLDKLSMMDLSQGSVQREGMNIFKPLLKDRGIVADDYLTSKYGSILSEAERYKKDVKTKGSGFHLDNLAYATRGFKGFNSNTKREELEGIAARVQDATYIPYYDVAKERMDILDKCKPNKITGPAGGSGEGEYLDTVADKSLLQSKLYGCLEGGVSDAYRQQMRISGVVRYGDNYKELRNDYLSTAQEKQKFYSEELSELEAKRAALAKQKGTEEQVGELDKTIKLHRDGIAKLAADVDSIKNDWNDDFMKANYDRLAADSYFRAANTSFAQAFAFRDIEADRRANPVWVAKFNQGQQNWRMAQGFTHDIEMEKLRSAYDLQQAMLTGKDKNGDKVNLLDTLRGTAASAGGLSQYLTTGIEEISPTLSKLNEGVAQSEATVQSTAKRVYEEVLRNPDLQKMAAAIGITKVDQNVSGEQWKNLWRGLHTYMQNAPDSDYTKQALIEAENAITIARNEKTIKQNFINSAIDEAKKANPGIQEAEERGKAQIFSSLTPISAGNQILSPARQRLILEGTDPEFGTKMQISNDRDNTAVGVIYNKTTGQTVAITPAVRQYQELEKNTRTAFRPAVDNILAKKKIVQRMGLSAGNVIEESNPEIYNYIQGVFGQSLGVMDKTPGENKVVFSSVGAIDPVSGKIRVQAMNKDGQIPASKLLEAVVAQGKGMAPGSSTFDGVASADGKTIEMTIPALKGLIQPPTYAEGLRSLFSSQAENIQSLPSQGVATPVGTDKRGARYSVKTIRAMSGGPEFVILRNGAEAFRTKSMEEAILQTSTLLQNKTLDTQIK